MATSGSKSVSVAKGLTLKFNWSQSSQSVSGNSTTISWTLQVILASGYSISSSASKDWSVTVNGKNYSGSNTLPSSGTKTMASGSATIPHNADGTKSFSYSFSQKFDINYSGSRVGTKTGSSTGTLNTIPRNSSVSGNNGNIGSAITININRASSSFTHTLRYSFHNLSGTIVDKTSSTSYSWTIPTSFYAQIPNAKSSWGTIYCDTYSGSTKIGTTSCTFNAYVKESTNKPDISATVVDVNDKTIALTGDANKLIKYHSKVKFSITSTPKNSSSTKSININYNGSNFTGGSGNSWTSYFSDVTSGKYICSVTDTRGFTTSTTINKTLINYIKPTCNLTTTLSADGVLVIKINGNYFNGSFGKANNSLQVAYRYGIKGGSYGGWIYLTPTFSGNTYSASTTVDDLDYEKQYMVQAWCGDVFYTNKTNGGVYSEEKPAFSKPIFDWGESDFNFNVPVYVGGKEMFHNGNCQFSSSGNCQTWRYPNGMQVSIVKVHGTWDVDTAWGSIYSSPHIAGQSFNIAFMEAPKVTINAYNATSAIMVCQCSAPTTTATGACYLWKPGKQTGIKTYIEYIAIGRWK